ncbi:DNA mismatch repair protein MutS [Abortiporus biennis]|nr:DNA mismatch repair protein MutS [Abortiporus biennis]
MRPARLYSLASKGLSNFHLIYQLSQLVPIQRFLMPRYKGVSKGRRQQETTSKSVDGDNDSSNAQNNRKRVRWQGNMNTGELAVSEDEAEENHNSEDTSENLVAKICLAISCQYGRIGCAYYDPTTCKMYVLEDTQESSHYDFLSMVLEQVNADLVLTTSRAEDGFIDHIRKHMDASNGVFQIRPHKDFMPSKGRDRVLSLRLLAELPHYEEDQSSNSDPSEPRNAYEFMNKRREVNGDPTQTRWQASIRLANYAAVDGAPLCLGSIGALLDHLSRVRAVGELDDEGIGGLEIRGIEYMALNQVMQINADALYSLQVFDTESHASVNSDKTKEGLSLFGILNSTRTSLGRSLLREWLLRPSLSLDVIKGRHDAVSCFTRPENISVAQRMHGHLNGIKNVPRIIGVMKSGKGRLADWQGIVKFAYHSVLLRDSLPELSHGGSVPIVLKLAKSLDVASSRDIGASVNEIIDWDESAIAGRVVVRPHINDELDQLKHSYNGIDSVLSKVAERISVTVPSDYAASLNVVYFPQLGYLICVPMLEEWKTDAGITVLDGWTFQFSSESHAYFKSQEMRDMDKYIGDLHSAIVDLEIEIIQALLDNILIHADSMSTACDICAELDCLLSFAEATRAYDWRQPDMTEENIIDIRKGRHPLQELVVDTFVPNDAFVVGGDWTSVDTNTNHSSSEDGHDTESTTSSDIKEQNSIVVCTGANACGKSVYLKQIALIQYMAQIGCFVPAEKATLGIVDHIFTRIQTRESVSKVQSAFMIDLNQVSLALRNCTAKSLILLDEFGKGTITSDGAGLFCGVLKHFVKLGSECPKVLAATHFHEIFTEDLLEPTRQPITFLHMQVLFTSRNGQVTTASNPKHEMEEDEDGDEQEENESWIRPGERITYLYRIKRGLWLNSHAAKCAEIFGIPRKIVKRACYVSYLLSMHEWGRLLDEEMTADEREELTQAEEVCRRFLALDFDSTDGK